MERPVQITRVQAFAMRCPIETPVATSFGVMRDRRAVFVRIEDRDGCFGWGEAFANWPAAGGENIAGSADFERVLFQGFLGVVQPDVIK